MLSRGAVQSERAQAGQHKHVLDVLVLKDQAVLRVPLLRALCALQHRVKIDRDAEYERNRRDFELSEEAHHCNVPHRHDRRNPTNN